MGMVQVLISDISGSRVSHRRSAGANDVPVNRVLVVLVERMNLPLNSPDGQLMKDINCTIAAQGSRCSTIRRSRKPAWSTMMNCVCSQR